MNIGDIILFTAFAVGLFNILLLFKGDIRIKWFTRVFVFLLSIDIVLLIYYFILPELTINYVWTFTSRDLPILYKVMGAFAGQQGTFLFWSFLIGLQTLWLSEKNKPITEFISKIHIVMLAIGLYFIGLTLLNSPFLTIFDLYPELSASFVPADGAGLNPLLITIWMAVHPPIIFLGYAMMTLPFATAIVYLYKSLRDKSSVDSYRTWIHLAFPWARASWLMLTAGIAIGAVWSYEVLGWGGFWAWDPVETASLIPWLLLTAALHSMADHSVNSKKFSILTPSLISFSFVLVIFAALVTRSGFFESIHAFGAGSVGIYLLILTVLPSFTIVALASLVYIKSKKNQNIIEESSFLNRTNIFYLAISSLIILTFITFWGIIFPAINLLILGTKIGVTRDFFDIWMAPFMIGVMLLMGLGLNYRHQDKKKIIKIFILFVIATIVFAFIKPEDAYTYIHYTSVTGPEKPLLYTLIGSASILSIIPPSVYIFYGAIDKVLNRIKPSKSRKDKMKQIGIIIIHIGVVFIVLGWIFSANYSEEFSTSLSIENKGQIILIPQSSYSVSLVDYRTDVRYSETIKAISGQTITEFYEQLVNDIISQSVKDDYTVSGRVEEVINVGSYTYIRLVEITRNRELWVATETMNVIKDTILTTSGFPMINYTSTQLNKTFDVILFSTKDAIGQREIVTSTEQIKVAIFEGDNKIAEGNVESILYEMQNSDVQKVMINRGLLRDTYVIFSGAEGDVIPLTIKIIPMMSSLWFGIILMMTGISLTLLFEPRFKESKV